MYYRQKNAKPLLHQHEESIQRPTGNLLQKGSMRRIGDEKRQILQKIMSSTTPRRIKKYGCLLRPLTYILLAASSLILWEAERGPGDRTAVFWSNAVYVWQTVWKPEVSRAIVLAAEENCALFVLVAEFQYTQNTLKVRHCSPDWKLVQTLDLPVTAVLRLETNLAPLFDPDNTTTRQEFLNALTATLNNISQQLPFIKGVQIDFDCPTGKLKYYGQFLAELRNAWADIPISITMLPTWLKSRHTKNLYENIDYFVLQAHALYVDTSREIWGIFDSTRFDHYIYRASAVGIPYYIALPTYGYGIILDDHQDLVGIRAESSSTKLPEGFTTVEVRADPEEIARIAQKLRANPPENCLGIAWFRLPIETDDRNWSWDMLKKAMGRDAIP